MRLLDRYLLRELLVPLSYCLGGFLIFYVAFDLITGLKGFQEKHLTAADLAEYYVVILPEFMVAQVIPVSLLLALLHVLTNHSRHHELTAMRAAGVSLWRLSLPYLGVGIFFGLVVFALNELVVPESTDWAGKILRRHLPQPEKGVRALKMVFSREGREWEISGFNPVTTEMIDPAIQWELPDGSHRHIYADRGIYANGQWVFSNVEEWTSDADRKKYPVLTLKLPETPTWIRIAIKVAAVSPTAAAKKPQLSIREILDYLGPNPRLNPELRATLQTQLDCQWAEPFTCLAVVLIALPFGARTGRHNVFVGAASSVFICFAYFIMKRISMGMGIGGNLTPVLAAWLPNLVFGLTGVVLIWRAR